MIPKKGSREIIYKGVVWRYRVKVNKDKWTCVDVSYNDPSGKYHKKTIEVIDEYYWGGEGQKREFTPSDFIHTIIKQFHKDTNE